MSDSGPCLTLLIPGLLGPIPGSVPARALTSLETLLGRARRGGASPQGFHATLCALFQIPYDGPPPVAPLCRLGDGLPADGDYWLRLDPVHLEAGMHSVHLNAYQGLPILWNEARALVDEVNRLYQDLGWHLEPGSPHRWYLRLPEPLRLETTPVGEMLGKDIASGLPRGADGLRWHAYLNEMQMLLHASAVNQGRERRGELSINGLWPWGGGVLPTAVAVPWRQLASSECLGRGLATLCGVPQLELPADAERWLEQERQGASLLVMDGLRQAIQHQDWAQWWAGMERLEQHWFAPLWAALLERRVDALTVYDGQGGRWHLDRAALGRWWRRRRPLNHWMHQHA